MLGFIIAILCGAVIPMIEDTTTRPLAKAMDDTIRVEPGEMRLLGFIVMMLVASLLGALFGSGNAFAVVLGGAVGYFGARIIRALRKTIDPPTK